MGILKYKKRKYLLHSKIKVSQLLLMWKILMQACETQFKI